MRNQTQKNRIRRSDSLRGLICTNELLDLKREVEAKESYYEMSKERKDKSRSKGRLLMSACERLFKQRF